MPQIKEGKVNGLLNNSIAKIKTDIPSNTITQTRNRGDTLANTRVSNHSYRYQSHHITTPEIIS